MTHKKQKLVYLAAASHMVFFIKFAKVSGHKLIKKLSDLSIRINY